MESAIDTEGLLERLAVVELLYEEDTLGEPLTLTEEETVVELLTNADMLGVTEGPALIVYE